MNYRIRFRTPENTREDEVVVEANSPNEALIKFRCTHERRTVGRLKESCVTSVSSDAVPDDQLW